MTGLLNDLAVGSLGFGAGMAGYLAGHLLHRSRDRPERYGPVRKWGIADEANERLHPIRPPETAISLLREIRDHLAKDPR